MAHMNESEMRRYVVDLVRATSVRLGLPRRSMAAEVVAAMNLPNPIDGDLPPDKDAARIGRQIILNRRLVSAERREFTIFHEVLHIMLEDDGEIISQLHDHFYGSSDRERQWLLEQLCQLGVGEFMLPAEPFAKLCAEHGWHVWALETAASTFRCSVVATAFQFAHYHPDACAVVICEPGLPEPRATTLLVDVPTTGRSLIVAYTAKNAGGYAMCRRVPVPDRHLISHVWRDGQPREGEDIGFFRSRKDWRIPCQAVRIGARVYSAFYPKGRKIEGKQVALFE